jgi:hypothetical protein
MKAVKYVLWMPTALILELTFELEERFSQKRMAQFASDVLSMDGYSEAEMGSVFEFLTQKMKVSLS